MSSVRPVGQENDFAAKLQQHWRDASDQLKIYQALEVIGVPRQEISGWMHRIADGSLAADNAEKLWKEAGIQKAELPAPSRGRFSKLTSWRLRHEDAKADYTPGF